MFNLKLQSSLSAIFLSTFGIIQFPSLAKAEQIVIAQNFNSEDFLTITADMMNQRLPMMIGSDVRWNSASAGPGKNLNYNYTLVNYSAVNLDGSQFANNVRTLFTQQFCHQPSGQMFFQEGISLNANYYDRTNNLIARVKVDPSDCGY